MSDLGFSIWGGLIGAGKFCMLLSMTAESWHTAETLLSVEFLGLYLRNVRAEILTHTGMGFFIL